MSTSGDVTMDSIRAFITKNKMALVEETVSYAKEIVAKVDGDGE